MDPVLHWANAISHGSDAKSGSRPARGPEGTIVLSRERRRLVRTRHPGRWRGIEPGRLARAGPGLPCARGLRNAATLLFARTARGLYKARRVGSRERRGVGMSVVQPRSKKLSGSMRIETEKARGKRFV